MTGSWVGDFGWAEEKVLAELDDEKDEKLELEDENAGEAWSEG